MSAEGNLSDPTIFAKMPDPGWKSREYWRGRNGQGGYRLDGVIRRYFGIIYQYVLEIPEPGRSPLYLPGDSEANHAATDGREDQVHEGGRSRKKRKKGDTAYVSSPSLKGMQGHLFQMLRPMLSNHTEIRDALAKTRVGDMAGFERVLTMVEKAIKKGLQEYDKEPNRAQISQEEIEADHTGQDEEVCGSARTIAKYKRPWWLCQPYIRPLPEEAMKSGALKVKKKDEAKMKAVEMVAGTAAMTRVDVVEPPIDVSAERETAKSALQRPALICG